MSDLFCVTEEKVERLRPYFPESHGKARVDDRRVLSGIVFVSRDGLQWRDVRREYGPHKTLYNRWKRWGIHSAGAASALDDELWDISKLVGLTPSGGIQMDRSVCRVGVRQLQCLPKSVILIAGPGKCAFVQIAQSGF